LVPLPSGFGQDSFAYCWASSTWHSVKRTEAEKAVSLGDLLQGTILALLLAPTVVLVSLWHSWQERGRTRSIACEVPELGSSPGFH
jgi:hypothetical protein